MVLYDCMVRYLFNDFSYDYFNKYVRPKRTKGKGLEGLL